MNRKKKPAKVYSGKKILVVDRDSSVADMRPPEVTLADICKAITSVGVEEEIKAWLLARQAAINVDK